MTGYSVAGEGVTKRAAGALACTEVLELLLELLEFVLAQGQGAACCVDLDTQEGDALARPHHLFPTDQKS